MKSRIIIALWLCLFATRLYAIPLQPKELRCEFKKNPLGIDSRTPRLSWTFEQGEPNQLQGAYEIIVADDEKAIKAGKGNCWISGKVSTNQSLHIIYAGEKLKSGKRYYWRVKIYNQGDEASTWSEPAWFETGLDHNEWKAQWINDGSSNPLKDEDYYKPDRMPLLRKRFVAKKNIVSARLYISGLGYYEAYLNGKKIGDYVLDPGFTTYRKQVQYSVYDITALLKPGQNNAGLMVGSGWWNPLPFKLFGRWDLRNYQQSGRPCVKAEFHIIYASGNADTIVTDDSWQTAPGPIIHNNVYLGEVYDARLEQDWNGQSADWKTAVIVKGADGILTAQQQPPIKITKVIKAVSVMEQGKDTFIVDMGQNFAGVARIKVKGPAGTNIHLRFGEALFPDGTLNYMTSVTTQIKKGGIKGGPGAPETAWQQDEYILKGNGVEEWAPRFTFHGFRYVEITGWPGKPAKEDVEGLRMNSDLETVGQFECSNDMFNKLHSVIQWTFLSNVFSVQSDCPAREKMGYGGDMVATANSYIYNYNMADFYRKAVRDFANDQRPLGGITEIAPFTGIADRGYGDDSGPLGWQLAFPFLQKQLYDYYGDREVIESNYEAFKKQLAFLEAKAVEGMFYWDISDHEALDAKPEALTASAFYYHHLILGAEFAGILKKNEDSLKYAKQAARLKRTLAEKFLVAGTGRFDNGTQSAQLFALYYELSPEKEKSLNALMKEFERHNWHLATGIFSTKMMFDVLMDNGAADTLYRIVNQRDFPGWGHMLKGGATTLWETWEYPESGPSQNHPMFGSIDEWFFKSVLGIRPAGPGFEKIIIRPSPCGDLQWAKGNFLSVRGMIGSDWKKNSDRFILKVSIPPNTTAEVWIPSKQNGKIMEHGKAVDATSYRDGYAIINTGSGEYTFETKN